MHPVFACLLVQLSPIERGTKEEISWDVCVTGRNNTSVQADMGFISEESREVTVREGLGLRG